MAVRECKDCGGYVSSRAKMCPHCGAPVRQDPGPIATLLSFLLMIAICAGCFNWLFDSTKAPHVTEPSDARPSQNRKTPDEPPRKELTREERIRAQFSPWDGSHRGLTKVIKNIMNDPKSYQHVKTVYWDRGDYLIVKTTFRGTNVFGGVVTNWIKAKVDLDGNVLEILDQGP